MKFKFVNHLKIRESLLYEIQFPAIQKYNSISSLLQKKASTSGPPNRLSKALCPHPISLTEISNADLVLFNFCCDNGAAVLDMRL